LGVGTGYIAVPVKEESFLKRALDDLLKALRKRAYQAGKPGLWYLNRRRFV